MKPMPESSLTRSQQMPVPDEQQPEPTRAELDESKGPVLVEFGARWCPHCQALAPTLADRLARYPDVRFIRVEDGPGRPLGRSFRVKLWPNLVFLRDGKVIKQVARPSVAEVEELLEAISGSGQLGAKTYGPRPAR
jgi:thioredoxin 1